MVFDGGLPMPGFRPVYCTLILFVFLVAGCTQFEESKPAPDTQQPTVYHHTPSDEAILVDHETIITVTFNEIINHSSVNSNTFSIRNVNNILVDGTYDFIDGYDYYEGALVRLVPDTRLDGDSAYYVTVTTGITDLAGNHLDADVSWSFTTAPAGIGTWIPTSLSQPILVDDTLFLTSVWTGSEMLVWGGSSGYRYNPATDELTAISTLNAPSHRHGHTAVWTGTEMIIWGGSGDNYLYLNDGARYNPANDTWQSMSTSGAPEGRNDHTAVWTGSRMLIWGGRNGGFFAEYPSAGGVYDPDTDTWTAMTTGNVPSGRRLHTAVWTGQEMLVWGGMSSIYSDSYYLSSGGRYNPLTDTWLRTTNSDVPVARALHTAIWSGSDMIIWGGFAGDGQYLASGAKYNPVTDTWTPTAAADGLLPRYDHSAVWTGNSMIIWGGYTNVIDTLHPRTGGIYYPQNDTWLYTTTANAPPGRTDHASVWTGSEMIIWGGSVGSGDPMEIGGGVYRP
jgi:hypothetical protein